MPLTDAQMDTVSAGSGQGVSARPGLPAAVPSFVPPLLWDDSIFNTIGKVDLKPTTQQLRRF
jgi:hypothetical protein